MVLGAREPLSDESAPGMLRRPSDAPPSLPRAGQGGSVQSFRVEWQAQHDGMRAPRSLIARARQAGRPSGRSAQATNDLAALVESPPTERG